MVAMQTQLYIIENTKKKHKWEVDDSMSVSMHGVGNLNLSVSTALTTEVAGQSRLHQRHV